MLLLAAVQEELGDFNGEVVGVGPIVAATRTATLLVERQPRHVVLIGTGGAYPNGPDIGSAIAASQVGMSYGVAAMGLGYIPRAPGYVECSEELLNQIDLPRHNVLTANAVTTDPVLAERLSDGWTVEHLEAFGVAWACQMAGVPFTAVLGIANKVGPDAHTEWLTHRDDAQKAAQKGIEQLVNASYLPTSTP